MYQENTEFTRELNRGDKIIGDIEKKLEWLYPGFLQRTYIKRKLKELAKNNDSNKVREDILRKIDEFVHDLKELDGLSSFLHENVNNFAEYEKDKLGEEQKNISDDKKEFIHFFSNLNNLNLSRDIIKALQKIEGDDKSLEGMLDNIKKRIDEKYYGGNLEYQKNQIEGLITTLQKIKSDLEQEKAISEQTVDGWALEITNISKQIRKLILAEKEEVYEPMHILLRRTQHYKDKVGCKQFNSKAIKKDIRKDLAKFDRPEEGLEYIWEIENKLRKSKNINNKEDLREFLFLKRKYLNKLAEMRNKKVQSLKKLAFKDPLTQVDNRNGVEKYLDSLREQMSKDSRGNTTRNVSIIIADIDNFKSFNDNYGHDIGDQVLEEVAKIIQKYVRRSDEVARFGGEEFIIILDNTTKGDAKAIADRIREETEKQSKKIMESINKKYDHITNQSSQITLSMGISTFGDTPEKFDFDELLKESDMLLYTAKRNGRNQVQAQHS